MFILESLLLQNLCHCSVTKSCLTLCDPMDCSMPGFPVLHYFPEFAQTHVHWVSDAIQPSHPLSPLLHLPSIFPSIRAFPNESALRMREQSIGASASVLPTNIRDWFPLGWTGWISLQSKGLSRVFSNTIVQKHQFFGTQPSLQSNSHIHTWLLEKPIALTRWTFVDKVMSLLFNKLSRFVTGFLPRSKCFLISQSTVIWEPKKIKSVTVSIVSPSICHEVKGPDAMIFIVLMLSFKPGFSLFHFYKRLFSSS